MLTGQPKIKARFLLDADGRPRGRSSGHYAIRLSIDEPPPDSYAVTYELDDSYYDPIRESRNQSGGFPEEITSYGDYPIVAKIRTRHATTTIKRSLAEALDESHHGDPGEDVKKALSDIRKN